MQNCRLCKADKEFQTIRAPHVFGGNEEHNFWRCQKCEAIYLFPIPSIEDEKKFYLNEFEAFMSSRVGDHRDWSNAEKHKKTNQDRFLFLCLMFREKIGRSSQIQQLPPEFPL